MFNVHAEIIFDVKIIHNIWHKYHVFGPLRNKSHNVNISNFRDSYSILYPHYYYLFLKISSKSDPIYHSPVN